MMNETPTALLIVADVARWLRIRNSTVYAWAASGKIPTVRLHGTVRFIRAEIECWLQNHSRGAAGLGPSTTRLIGPPTPAGVSRHTLERAGARAIRRVMGRQRLPRHSKSEIPRQTDNTEK